MTARRLDCFYAGLLGLVIGALAAQSAFAQQPGSGLNSPTGADVGGCGNSGHICFYGGALPTVAGGTLDDGSTDNVGTFVASAASGSITFGAAFTRPPACDVDSYTGANPATYTVNQFAITLSTITSGVRYVYHCYARPGG